MALPILNSTANWAKVRAAFKASSQRFSGDAPKPTFKFVDGRYPDAIKAGLYNSLSISSGKKGK